MSTRKAPDDRAKYIPESVAIAIYYGNISLPAFKRGQKRGEFPPTIKFGRLCMQSVELAQEYHAENIRKAKEQQERARNAPKRGPGRPRKHPRREPELGNLAN
jgi:hypothetical protein